MYMYTEIYNKLSKNPKIIKKYSKNFNDEHAKYSFFALACTSYSFFT